MALLGIDLGTTNSLGVIYRNSGVELVPNAYHEYLTPSAVYIDKQGNAIVGKVALQKFYNGSNNAINLFKRLMGKSEFITLRGKRFLPEQLSALIVQQIIQDAETYLNEKIDEVVISVPAYFNAVQRKATKKIGDYLKIKVNRIINEPSAAALQCFGFKEDETFVVFDFGGGTLDVSVVDCFDNVVSICAIAGDNQLGGIDFDTLICEDFLNKNKLSLSKNAQEKPGLLQQCEKIKLHLQTHDHCDTKIKFKDSLYEYSLTNDEFAKLSASIFERIRLVIARAIKESGFSKQDINKLILVGGSCYMPILQRFVRDLVSVDIELVKDIDYLVVQGLGRYIGIKQRDEEVKDLVLTDICPFTLNATSINYENRSNPYAVPIIRRNSVLPISRTIDFYTAFLRQTSVIFEVNQGESTFANENLYLGRIKTEVPYNEKDYEKMTITYAYDINSLLHIEVVVCATGDVRHYVVDGEELNEVEEDQEVQVIEAFSTKISSASRVEFLKEKTNLVQALLEDQDQARLVNEKWQEVRTQVNTYQNNLKLQDRLLSDYERFITRIENTMYNLDIFTDFDEGDSGSFFS